MDIAAFSKLACELVGGLGLFLLGMKHMSEGMQAVAGASLRRMIERCHDQSHPGHVGRNGGHVCRAIEFDHDGDGCRFRQQRSDGVEPGNRRHHGRQHRHDHHGLDSRAQDWQIRTAHAGGGRLCLSVLEGGPLAVLGDGLHGRRHGVLRS